MTSLRLGTRGSQLALYQARTVARLIGEAGGPPCKIDIVKTSGDRLQDAPLSEIGGKRLFVKELEDALLRDEIDLAVHSSKDLPAVLPDGLRLAGVLPRADARDAVVLPRRVGGQPAVVESLDHLRQLLGPQPSIGTSSVRRIAQLTRALPGATFAPIRGNLDTRLRKVDAGDYHALVLATAGLQRLELDERISWRLPVELALPAPGQGIIAVEIRTHDDAVARVVGAISDDDTWAALDAERALVEALGGGCQTPIGAFAAPRADGRLHLTGSVISLDGQQLIQKSQEGTAGQAAALGRQVAAALLADGAAAILESVRTTEGTRAPAHE